MQRDPRIPTPLGAHYAYAAPVSPAFGVDLAGTNPPLLGQYNGLEFEPCEDCPRNFIIFDQTNEKGRVMFHPALVHNLSSTNNSICPLKAEIDGIGTSRKKDKSDDYSSSFKENTEEIDALLSSDEETDGEDDEMVSTGRTPGYYDRNFPDSSCLHKPSKLSFSLDPNSTSNGSIGKDGKGDRMRTVLGVLREIIPGGEQLDASAVLDEAVRYLKYLKMEAEKLGIQSFDNESQ